MSTNGAWLAWRAAREKHAAPQRDPGLRRIARPELGATLRPLLPWLALAGVAFAAGGFTIAAVVYIFRLEPYHMLARRAVLL